MSEFDKTVAARLCSFSTMWLERHGVVWIGILCGTLEWVDNRDQERSDLLQLSKHGEEAGRNRFSVNYKSVGRHSLCNWWCLYCKQVQRCQRTRSPGRRLQMLLMTYTGFLISFLLVWEFWLLVASTGLNSGDLSASILDYVCCWCRRK